MRESDEIDLLLKEHFASELDRHAGGAQRAFAERRPVERTAPLLRWLVPGTVGAMAASLVIGMVMMWAGHRGAVVSGTDGELPPQAKSLAQVEPPTLERAVAWQAIDEGPVLLGEDLPVRRVREQMLQRVRWHDPELNTTIEMTVPRERIIYVEMESY